MSILKVTIPEAALLFEKKNLRKALKESAQSVAKEARALTRNAGGSGRVYATPRTMVKGYHQASAPGEPPASLTGLLSRSIKTSIKGDRVRVFDTAFYSKFLETGAQGGGGTNQKGGKGTKNTRAKKNQPKPAPSTVRVLEPRTFISRALDDQKATIEKKLIEAIEKDIELT